MGLGRLTIRFELLLAKQSESEAGGSIASGRVTESCVAGPGMWGCVGRQRRGWLAIFCPNSYCGSTIVAVMRLQGADEFMATTRGFFGARG